MVKFTFDYKDLVKSVKLIKKTTVNKKENSFINSSLIIASESESSCCLSNRDFSQFISAKIEGVGSISMSFQILLKLLSTYKGSQTFTIETISDSVSLINDSFKVNTINDFNNKPVTLNKIETMKELPKYHETFVPILETLENGKPLKGRELEVKIRDKYYYDLPQELLDKKTKSDTNVLLDRISWGKSYLKMGKFVHYPQRGYVQITDKGRQVLNKGVFTLEDLQNDDDFIKYREAVERKKDNEVERDIFNIENASPQDLIDSGVNTIEAEVKTELLERLKEVDPFYFERVILKLLKEMGYGEFVETKKTGDGGIDGIINEDKLGLEKIYTQAKRYNENKVREKDIRNFIGAMSGDTTKGVFITTSAFDEGATKKAREARHTIVLIGGDKLVDLMYEYNVGIKVKMEYKVKELDNDFFEGE